MLPIDPKASSGGFQATTAASERSKKPSAGAWSYRDWKTLVKWGRKNSVWRW
jgi:hypothetical protein